MPKILSGAHKYPKTTIGDLNHTHLLKIRYLVKITIIFELDHKKAPS